MSLDVKSPDTNKPQVAKRTVLVDLSALKDVFCGLGQVALAYGYFFEKTYQKATSDYSLTLLMPKSMFGMFGNEVSYLDSTFIFRRFQKWYFPVFDVWHSVHQLSRFKPSTTQTKHILTIHDLNYLYETKGTQRLRKHKRLQNKVDRADVIVSISEFGKQEINTHLTLNGKQCQVIYNGVEEIVNKPNKPPKIAIKSPFFFSIGVIKKKKNFHVLLDMMKLFPQKHLYIAGKDTTKYAEEIKARIEAENIQNVTLLGAITEEEKNWLYKNCEAFLFPSLFEGFGIPIIEAMQFGKPVFSSQETSLKEIGGDFAYFWKNFNPEDMKQLIDEKLDVFYQNQSLIEQEKEYAHSFSYKKHFQEYEELYKNI